MRQNRPLLHGRFLDQNDVHKYIDIFSPSTTNNVIIYNKHNIIILFISFVFIFRCSVVTSKLEMLCILESVTKLLKRQEFLVQFVDMTYH